MTANTTYMVPRCSRRATAAHPLGSAASSSSCGTGNRGTDCQQHLVVPAAPHFATGLAYTNYEAISVTEKTEMKNENRDFSRAHLATMFIHVQSLGAQRRGSTSI